MKIKAGIKTYLATADDAFVLIVAEAALITDPHERGRAHVGVAYGTFTIALVTETADGDAGLLAAHDEIADQGCE